MSASQINVPTATSFGSRSHVGLVREHNEDSILTRAPLFVVCDGMGGHEAGEVASEIAVNVIADKAPLHPDAEALGRAVNDANLAIIRAVDAGVGREGMGTTCTAAMLEGEHLVIAQSGDSRAYLVHNGILQQLTRDHSLVADLVDSGEISAAEARTHPWRSYITRALGLDPRMEADLYELAVSNGDRLLICSDGLYSMVDDNTILQVLTSDPDPQAAANMLVEAALEAGGNDNVSVIVADVSGGSWKQEKKMARKTKITVGVIIALLIALIGGSVFALNWWATNSAYLGVVDGKVAIYQGIPGEILGIGHTRLDEVTQIKLDDLQPGVARRVESNAIRCDSLESARKLVAQYREELALRGVYDASSLSASSAADAADQAGSDAGSTSSASPDAAGGSGGSGNAGTGGASEASGASGASGTGTSSSTGAHS